MKCNKILRATSPPGGLETISSTNYSVSVRRYRRQRAADVRRIILDRVVSARPHSGAVLLLNANAVSGNRVVRQDNGRQRSIRLETDAGIENVGVVKRR